MARNAEIKARLEDAGATHRLVAAVADRGPETLFQTDTFFQVETGRLKLREFLGSDAELIYYSRPDTPGPKESQYARTTVSNAPALRALLSKTLGVAGCVRKKRLVYWVGRTRIHLDEVRNLGNFLELEVVLKEQEPFEAGVSEAKHLMERLEIDAASLLPDAYVDLLRRTTETTQT